MSTPTYNHRVFLIEDEDQQDQCQFVFVPLDGDAPKRCQKDGIYRIGLTIFLCDVHMPGVGRHPDAKPVKISKPEEKSAPRARVDITGVSKRSIHGHLLNLLITNSGQVVTYSEIESQFPTLVRATIQSVVSQLRRRTGSHIVNVPFIGYKYLGGREE